ESSAAPFARAIDYRPELRLSVQEHVDHRGSYKDLFHGAFDGTVAWGVLLDVTRVTATGLAELHRSGCRSGEPVTWDHELAILRAKQDRLALDLPVLAGPTGSVPDRLARAAATTRADPLVPSHHSFRPAQVLLTDDGVVFIDLDKFCQAEPACDIALFTAKLQHMGVNKASARVSASDREVRLAELRSTFLDEYRKHASVSTDRVGLWEAMELTSLVLSAAKKVNAAWVASCRRMLENHLQARGW
ncbi:MAG: phosphotransferase, partial [Pseudonocardia sp.]